MFYKNTWKFVTYRCYLYTHVQKNSENMAFFYFFLKQKQYVINLFIYISFSQTCVTNE